MATIKLQEGRVLTRVRDGRTFVQCECCVPNPPEECCMYPLDKLNILFTEDDWPEEGIMFANYTGELIGPITLEKNIGAAARFPGDTAIKIYGSTSLMIYYVPGYLDEYLGRAGEIDPGQGLCLFDDPEDTENPPSGGSNYGIWFYDNFQDTYSVTQTQPPRTFTVTRESPCIWRERASDGLVRNSLYYDTNANEQTLANSGGAIGAILWRFNGSRRTDAGPYNSPVGEYGNTWTVV